MGYKIKYEDRYAQYYFDGDDLPIDLKKDPLIVSRVENVDGEVFVVVTCDLFDTLFLQDELLGLAEYFRSLALAMENE